MIENRTWRTNYRGPLASRADKTIMPMKDEIRKIRPMVRRRRYQAEE
jgi:hypothetical protein